MEACRDLCIDPTACMDTRLSDRNDGQTTGSRPTSTRVRAGSEARAHSPSLVISKIRTARVSQPKGRISRVAGISLSTSTKTSSPALSEAGSNSGR